MTNEEAIKALEHDIRYWRALGCEVGSMELAIAALRERAAVQELVEAARAALEVLGAEQITSSEVTEQQAMHFQIVLALTAALAKFDDGKGDGG